MTRRVCGGESVNRRFPIKGRFDRVTCSDPSACAPNRSASLHTLRRLAPATGTRPWRGA
jgi:hypothetical protein